MKDKSNETEVISREEAIQKKLKMFFTGVPCVNGHLAPRYVSSQGCVTCTKQRQAERLKNPIIKQRARQYDKEKRVKYRGKYKAYLAQYYKDNRERLVARRRELRADPAYKERMRNKRILEKLKLRKGIND